MAGSSAHAAIESVARASYGRLLAYLASRTGDVAGAEDALGDAFASALRRWPEDGVPAKPEAWLLQAARNRQIDALRHDQVKDRSEDFVRQILAEAEGAAALESLPDERLKLLFVCAHPAIDPAARTPLMLQTVLGLDAVRIASAFLVSPAAMGQRLVRAKVKIREAGIPFRIPDPPEWPERVSFVFDAIYSAYNAGWESVIDVGSPQHALASEAISIGRTLTSLMPDEPEAHGLLALMLHCEARSRARYSTDGAFVPLDEQDPALWSPALIEEAETHLRTAAALHLVGRFQLEAAIQSIHAHRVVSGRIDWEQIALLYEGLVRVAPSLGARVGRAVARAEAGDGASGLAALDAMAPDRIRNYQAWWAARAHILRGLGREPEARDAFERAASLTEDPALRTYLMKRKATG